MMSGLGEHLKRGRQVAKAEADAARLAVCPQSYRSSAVYRDELDRLLWQAGRLVSEAAGGQLRVVARPGQSG